MEWLQNKTNILNQIKAYVEGRRITFYYKIQIVTMFSFKYEYWVSNRIHHIFIKFLNLAFPPGYLYVQYTIFIVGRSSVHMESSGILLNFCRKLKRFVFISMFTWNKSISYLHFAHHFKIFWSHQNVFHEIFHCRMIVLFFLDVLNQWQLGLKCLDF